MRLHQPGMAAQVMATLSSAAINLLVRRCLHPMHVVPFDHWLNVQLERYEAELRDSLRAELASDSTRRSAESHIARALDQRRRELEAKPSPMPTKLR